MVQEAETVAMELNIVSCQTCDALFIESERRQTCPSCGGPPVGPYFRFVLDGAGLHLKDGVTPDVVGEAAIRTVAVEEVRTRFVKGSVMAGEAVEELKRQGYTEKHALSLVALWIKESPSPSTEPAAEAPAVEEAPAGEGIKLPPSDMLPLAIESYLRGGEATDDDLRLLLTDLGAEPEAAAIAVGRLVAVRDLLRQLVEVSVEAQVEVAVEETPAEAPEPEPEPESGEKA